MVRMVTTHTITGRKVKEPACDSCGRPMSLCFLNPCEAQQEKPGSVCSECGRTVTNTEYSSGEARCCKAEVIAEEFYQ